MAIAKKRSKTATNGHPRGSERLAAVVASPRITASLTKYESTLDSYRRYVTDSPSPAKFAAWFKAADAGDVAAICEMQQEMEAKSLWFRGVMGTRRNAVTALEWDIQPDEKAEDQDAATEAADYCRDLLTSLETFPGTLEHLASVYGPNVAVVELVWSKAELAGTVDVPGHRLMTRPYEGPGVYIETTDNYQGIPTDPASYGGQQKFVVFHEQLLAGFPFRSTLTHAVAWPFLMIHFGKADWAVFLEKYGQPIPVATYDNTVINVDRTTVDEAFAEMSSDGQLRIPQGVVVSYLQAQGTGEVYPAVMDWARTEISVGVLGQTLTTDVGSVGSFAAAKVHDNVRADIMLADLGREARCIRNQVLRPMCLLRFGPEVPVPIFKRIIIEARNPDAAYPRIAQLNAAASQGLELRKTEVYESLDFTLPKDAEDDEGLWVSPVPIDEPSAPSSGPTDRANPAERNPNAPPEA